MYPDADIPSVQMSLVRGLDLSVHTALGIALRELIGENFLVVGSGFSWQGNQSPDPANDAFQNWPIDACTRPIAESHQLGEGGFWPLLPPERGALTAAPCVCRDGTEAGRADI